MRFALPLLLASISISINAEIIKDKEPVNIHTVRKELTAYHDSGRYQRAIDKITQRATAYLGEEVKKNAAVKHPAKLAAVFDIDETCLSNYPVLQQFHFAPVSDIENRYRKHDGAIAIKPMLRLYRYAKSKGVTIFFITGRSEKIRIATVKNLRAEGFNDWKKLYMYPNKPYGKSIVPFKTASRKDIAAKGYHVVLNIGDQYSDLRGGEAKMAFKVPNPYYYLP